MSLAAGVKLGPYEILAPLGAGGMGEVYRARDTRLRREVAVKVLPDAFARDSERLARFEREAQLLASVNHSNIAAIHGLEESGGVRFLVMELVPGETLAERLAAGPLPVEDALVACRQIAEALEAAHERGIIHRDLKPANVKVTTEGKVKVLDFGLAKALGVESSAAELSQSPTVTTGATGEGVVLGTAAYMSPEQARGRPLDKRSDIWAFGCVLYEALTGRQAFSGETVSDTIVAILGRDPDWQALPGATPAKIRDLLRRCMQKDASRRLHDIADARIEIEEALAEPAAATAAPVGAAKEAAGWRRALPWGLAAVLAAIAGTALWSPGRMAPSAPRTIKRFVISAPLVHPLALSGMPSSSTLVLSPDGSRLVYVAGRGGSTKLHLRGMDQFEATPVPGTEGASAPFFSPEGRQIGFFADGKLKKLNLTNGDMATLCTARWAWGGSWGPDDTIFFTPGSAIGIWKVPARGGEPQAVTAPDYQKGERSYRFPEILPGGKALLYTLITVGSGSSSSESSVAMLRLSTGERRVLVKGGSNAHYASTGHLAYARAGALLAVPFDLERIEVTGAPTPFIDSLLTDPGTAAAQFSVSSDGTLVYVPGGVQEARRRVVWVDRKGAAQPLTETPRAYGHLSLSPDGRRLAVAIAEGGDTDVWVQDLARGALTRLTFDTGIDHMPVWTPDGKRLAFSSNRAGAMDIYWIPADGSEPEKALLTIPLAQWPTSWSPDGRRLAYTEEDPRTGIDIWVLTLEGDRTPFLRTPFDERAATFAPDGHWLAYVSNESSRDEIYVRPFPGPGQKWQISTEGGSEPVWARNGRELFYRSGDRMMAVAVSTHPAFHAQKPRMLFEGEYERGGPLTSYDVSADGQRFAMIRSEEQSAPSPLHVVLNWFDELERRIPTGKNR